MKCKKFYMALYMTAMISIAVFSFPKSTSAACSPLNLGCKINEWVATEVNKATNQGMQWIRAEIIKPDSFHMPASTNKWLVITKIAGWTLFGIMFIVRMGFNISHPFVTGQLHFDEGSSFLLRAIGAGVILLSGHQFIIMAREYAASFTSYFGTVDFIWPITVDQFATEDYNTLGILLLGVLCILWVILYALYLFRDMMLNFLITATPLVGAMLVFSDRFIRIWWQFALTFILMKPIHAWAISYMIDYLADRSFEPVGKVLVAVFFFGLVLALPILIMGNTVRTTIKVMKDGGM